MHPHSTSPADRIHPYVRTWCAIVIVAAAAFVPSPAQLALIAAVAAACALICRVTWRKWVFGVIPMVTLVGGLAALSVIGGMRIEEVKLAPMGLFVGRCYTAFLAASALFASTDYVDVVRALEATRVPVLFTAITGYIFRWVGVVQSEAVRMNTARVLRGGGRRKKLQQIRDLGSLSVSMMIRAYLRAERAALAMECRGFAGRLVRSIPQKVRVVDFVPLAVLIGVAAVVILAVPK